MCRALRASLFPRLSMPSQKKTAESINSKLQLVMKSGKASLGYKQVLKTLRSGEGACGRCAVGVNPPLMFCPFPPFAAKLVLIAGNCPPLRKSELEYYAMLAKTSVHHFTGGAWLLLAIPFWVCVQPACCAFPFCSQHRARHRLW